MTDRQYQLMGRSAGASLSRPQGQQQLLHNAPAALRDAGALDLYTRSSLAQNPARFGNQSDYFQSVSRAQLMSERRSSLPAAYIDSAQGYVNNSDSRVLPTRAVAAADAAEVYPFSSAQRPLGTADLQRSRRAEIISGYNHSAAAVGGRFGRLGSLDDSVTGKEALRRSGAYLDASQGRLPPSSSYENQELAAARLAAMQRGVLGSAAGARKGSEMERYLLAVQPEKLVRYATTCLSPEPALKRARYAMMANNVAPPPELDVYSNYRQAKLRRSAARENSLRQEWRTDRPGSDRDRDRSVGTGSGSGLNQRRKEKDKEEFSRERTSRQKSDEITRGSDKKNNGSTDVKSTRDSRAPRSEHGNVSHGQNNSGVSRISQKQEECHRELEKEIDPLESDKDSELGSLGADLSDFENEKSLKTKESDEPDTVIDAPLDGMIFGCSTATFYECMKLQLFGLPTKNKDEVMRVAPGTKLFLFNFDTKELSGIFEAVSHGGMMIEPDAFREFGSFPAQVQVSCAERCPNIHLSDFKEIIKENFVSSFKFKFTLNASQVKDLTKLFRRAARIQPQIQQRQENSLLRRHTQEPTPSSEDYMSRSSQHSRQSYSQHSQASFGLSSNYHASKVTSLSSKKSKVHHEGPSRKTQREKSKKRKTQKRCPETEKRCPESPATNNFSRLALPEETDDKPDIAKILSKPPEDAMPSNTNISVLDGNVIVTDNSQEHKETVEATHAIPNRKGTDPLERDNGENGLLPGLQSDHGDCDGMHVSLMEDNSNSGKCGLAGERSEEQGKGPNVHRGVLDSQENVTTHLVEYSTSSVGMEEDLSADKTPHHLDSSPKKLVDVADEVPADKIGQLAEGISDYDGAALERAEAKLYQNLSLISSTNRLPHLAPVKDSTDDTEEEDDDGVTAYAPSDDKRLVDSRVADSTDTSTNVSDSSRSLSNEDKAGISEQLDPACVAEEDHVKSLIVKQEECLDHTEKDKPEDAGHDRAQEVDVNSNERNTMDSSHYGPATDTESMSSKEDEDEEMVDVDYDSARCEVSKTKETIKIVHLPKVDEVEEVIPQSCQLRTGDVQDMNQETDTVNSTAGPVPESDSIDTARTETEFVYCKYSEAEDEEDMVDYESSSQGTHENEDADELALGGEVTPEIEDEDELALVREVYGDMADEVGSEDEDQTLILADVYSDQRHESDENDEYLSLPDDSGEDEDFAETTTNLVNSEQVRVGQVENVSQQGDITNQEKVLEDETEHNLDNDHARKRLRL